MRLTRLTLTEFRNYAALTWQPASRIVVITGPNGSGKTNLLEAMSLLVPGRGLRGARAAELARQGGSGRWGVAARVERVGGGVEVGTGAAPDGPSDRRVFRLDGAAPRSQAEVAAVLAVSWLTPQMDRLFSEPASGRRRFLDRLVWALEPGHAREVSSYEAAMASRNRLLREAAEPAWLSALEDGMARHGVAVTAARLGMVRLLNGAVPPGSFPAARIGLAGELAGWVMCGPALDAEDRLRAALAAGRTRDAAAGGAQEGAHRADMTLADASSGRDAALASTGQQKALLIGLVLAHAGLIAAARSEPPLILLDEPLVHLDAERRAALFDTLLSGSVQVIMTGTDSEPFARLEGSAEALRTGDGGLVGTVLRPSHALY